MPATHQCLLHKAIRIDSPKVDFEDLFERSTFALATVTLNHQELAVVDRREVADWVTILGWVETNEIGVSSLRKKPVKKEHKHLFVVLVVMHWKGDIKSLLTF